MTGWKSKLRLHTRERDRALRCPFVISALARKTILAFNSKVVIIPDVVSEPFSCLVNRKLALRKILDVCIKSVNSFKLCWYFDILIPFLINYLLTTQTTIL